MDRKQEIFEGVLTNSFNTRDFVNFIKEMFVDVKIIAPDKGKDAYYTFSNFIEKYYHIGEFTDADGNRVGVFSIELCRGESVERARVTQRSFVKMLLEGNGYDGALIAFYSEGEYEKWRFSLIRMEYDFADGKLKKSLTPAKRYSYLVGDKEPCHTAKQRLLPILKEDGKNPTLDELEEAFSVEPVTKEFFEAYRDKYLEVKEFLEQNEDFVAESQRCNFTSEQFTKKLLSQIVFLYFIQKKGWLGVNAIPTSLSEKEYKNAFFHKGKKAKTLMPTMYKPRPDGRYSLDINKLFELSPEDEIDLASCVPNDQWGTGPKDFMRQIFEGCKNREKNFFDDYLEPLFYTGLNKHRDKSFFQPLHRMIPFLNGGLFEELDGYDWEHNDFQIPNELFSNRKGENDLEADGILDIFERYNFTMAEDEPMEKEVAVDPEVLGKVFENLLEIKDRKSKGAFYTPREIVHYMCQESLINYLTTKSGIPEEDIRKFILYGEYFKDEDCKRTVRVEGRKYNDIDKNKDFEMPETIFSYKKNVNRLEELDSLLASVKVVDPAVGSGAFPLGMLNEIVKARDTLSTYLSIEMNPYERSIFYAYAKNADGTGARNIYDLKKETIKNCIYACDIEPSATDITKLRLWLSLVIEDEIATEMAEQNANGGMGLHSEPRKLPNLECNIICGNSLIDSFEGIDLISESEVLNNISGEQQVSFVQQSVDPMIATLINLQDKLFNCQNHNEKDEIKANIQDIYNKIILKQLESNPAAVEKYMNSLADNSRPFVLWQLYFPKVFCNNGGFDVAIGNPPYVSTKGRDDKDKEILEFEYGFADDLYSHFIFKGFELLRTQGVLTMITPDTYFTTVTKDNLRKKMLEYSFVNLVHLGHDIFETAMVSTAICVIKKQNNANNNVNVIDVKNHKSLAEADVYQCPQETLVNSINSSFFVPNEYNIKLNKKFSHIHSMLVESYWGKIINSSKAEKNKDELDAYRSNLKPGDFTLIGLVTEGGQGLATANNGRFIGVRFDSKQAITIKDTRIKKLDEFNKDHNTSFELPDSEHEIWELFEKIKSEYGLKAFGQGYIYRIVSDDLISDIDTLSKQERENGICSKKTYVRYDKGDKEGNRWYYESPFLIDWSKSNVKFLKENSGKKGNGMPVLRNPQFYFREGFCWNNNLNENYIDIKCKMKEKSVPDVASMSLYAITNKIPAFWIILTINNRISGTIYRKFLNATVNVQMNDIKLLPIIVPTEEQLVYGKELFDNAVKIQKEYYSNVISESVRNEKINEVQEQIERFFSEIYKLSDN